VYWRHLAEGRVQSCEGVYCWHLVEGRVQSCEFSDEYADFIQFSIVTSRATIIVSKATLLYRVCWKWRQINPPRRRIWKLNSPYWFNCSMNKMEEWRHRSQRSVQDPELVWTTSKEQSPSWEPSCSSPSQEIPRSLWNQTFYHRVYNSPPRDPIQSHISPVHSLSILYVVDTFYIVMLLRRRGCPFQFVTFQLFTARCCQSLTKPVVNPSPNHLAGEPTLVSCPRLLIEYIRSDIPRLQAVSSIRNLRTGHAVVTGTHLSRAVGKRKTTASPGDRISLRFRYSTS
jgi:hypothetical protein